MSADQHDDQSKHTTQTVDVSVADVIAALRPISGPNNQGLVDQEMIKDVVIEDGEVSLTVTFATEVSRDIRHSLEDAIYDAIVKIDGVDDVEIEVDIPASSESSSSSSASTQQSNSEPGLSVYGSGGSKTSADVKTQSTSAQSPTKSAEVSASTESRTGGVSQVKHLIAIGSGKGGVGKSTIAANLALSLAKAGAKVGFCDIDLYGPSAPIIFGVSGAKVKADGELKKFIPIDAYGLKIMSIGFLIDEETPVIWRGPIVGSIVKQFLDETNWGELDYLIIDLPPGTGDAQLTLTQSVKITGALMVTTPSELSVADAIKGMQMFRKVNIPILGVVENMSYYVCSECGHESAPFNQGGTERMCVNFGTQVLVRLPLDEATQRGGDEGRPIVVSQPDHPLSQTFGELADRIIEKLPFKTVEKKTGLLSSLFKR
jgi:ATP-binding protein involved in chromosome partitioning